MQRPPAWLWTGTPWYESIVVRCDVVVPPPDPAEPPVPERCPPEPLDVRVGVWLAVLRAGVSG
ncbi:hypothetical protein AB0L10_25295 [Streptomyces flaveolus]|uniref:hypothetical protein n=1 Tax=Streptomyces flaveolus TaxID=67297 RepID=UPI003427AAE5